MGLGPFLSGFEFALWCYVAAPVAVVLIALTAVGYEIYKRI